MIRTLQDLDRNIRGCVLCEERFSQTSTAHKPRPITWLNGRAPILIAGQAPGARVYKSGIPFDDPSGERLRDWMGVGHDTFYDRAQVSILPMAFCFPGYDQKGSDLPPPAVCRKTWHLDVLQHLSPRLTLLVGGYAQKYHIGAANGASVSATVQDWRSHAPHVFPLPHPSWRNTGWIKKNPWFEADLLPVLRGRVQEVLNEN
ncbi:uracil-DNA glycosylase family protein [Falsihalocynthiibacter arcticus]|uniref:Uracil-DNA glycosylase n=1 Tax=Falsihalocynthiibacter arcticus TaxID=1579316 RepID=A0A126UVP2_9RHOB|nr:uracil-DNA glycosylase family protein [Falsihalocynthiibacter arcticus]AML50142.1 uracil-DNA glycosylase [Falsihalocynthiibacter arcticus]